MEQQLRRYFFGVLGFAFIVTWTTLGATSAVVATVTCLAGANLHRLLPRTGKRQLRSERGRRVQPTKLTARPLRAEHVRAHQLVPEEPSLIISTQS
jgi:hypothetical protein